MTLTLTCRLLRRYISPEVIKGCGHSSAVDWWCVGILTYEMMFGTTPFKGPNRHATFSNVLRNDVGFPDYPPTSQLARHIIRKLLIKDENKRLGSQSGASEVKSHKWFAPITWGLLRNTRPPIVPAATVRFFFFYRSHTRLDLFADPITHHFLTSAEWTGYCQLPRHEGLEIS
jgi:serine/threonine protein kinase